MEDLSESTESKRFEPEYSSIISLDSLNYECLLEIFQYLPLCDLLQLRYFCRTLNNAVCEHIRTSNRKLAVFMTRHEPNFRFNPGPNWYMFPHQSHFRWESFTVLNTPEESPIEPKIASLILFVKNRMSNITKLALLAEHDDYFRFLDRLILPAPRVKVLFIDLAYFYRSKSCSPTPIVDAISGMTQLESLYYFRSCSADDNLSSFNVKPVLLTNGQLFLEVMLKRLRVLHIHRMVFPRGVCCDKLEELSLFYEPYPAYEYQLNSYPVLRTLIDTSYVGTVLTIDDISFLRFVKVLKIISRFEVQTKTMEALNQLPNLHELHCRLVHNPNDVPTRNRTILRLFTNYPFLDVIDSFKWDEQEVSITTEQKDEYVERCRKYFPSLKMLKNERPEVTMEF